MDHIVSYKKGACITEMEYYKSTAQKTSDLRRWRNIRKNMNGGVILFFADGTVFDTFLSVYSDHKYWRHYYRLKKQKIPKETLLACYKLKFEKWSKIVIEKNGIRSHKKSQT